MQIKCIFAINTDSMGQFAQLEIFAEFKKVIFYTVRFEEEDLSETDKFFSRFRDNHEYHDKVRQMAAFIEAIGNHYGAKIWLFRDENAAEALPPEYRTSLKNGFIQFLDYDVRLFCIRLNEGVVILLNGGVKTAQKVNDCPDLLPKFRLAQKISKSITEKIISKEWVLKTKEIEGKELEF